MKKIAKGPNLPLVTQLILDAQITNASRGGGAAILT